MTDAPPRSDASAAPNSPTPLNNADRWTKWLPMMTALAVAVTPIGVATITSQVAVSGTNKDYVSLAISVLNSDRSTPAMRAWATNILEKLAPIPMQANTRRDFESGRASATLDPQSCGHIAVPGSNSVVEPRGVALPTVRTGIVPDGAP